MLEAEEEKYFLELTGWELEELYQALAFKREAFRDMADVDDYCLLERIEVLLESDDRDYCQEKVRQYCRQWSRRFIEYGRLEQFQLDHDWKTSRAARQGEGA